MCNACVNNKISLPINLFIVNIHSISLAIEWLVLFQEQSEKTFLYLTKKFSFIYNNIHYHTNISICTYIELYNLKLICLNNRFQKKFLLHLCKFVSYLASLYVCLFLFIVCLFCFIYLCVHLSVFIYLHLSYFCICVSSHVCFSQCICQSVSFIFFPRMSWFLFKFYFCIINLCVITYMQYHHRVQHKYVFMYPHHLSVHLFIHSVSHTIHPKTLVLSAGLLFVFVDWVLFLSTTTTTTEHK